MQSLARTRTIIAGMPGSRRLTLSRYREHTSTSLLLVEWDQLEDRTVGLRGSPEHQRWRRLLHRFDDPFPVVEHDEPVLNA